MQADASEINGATDAGLTPFAEARRALTVAIQDDRLFTVSEVATLLEVRKTDVYEACDSGSLRYVKFEGIVQIEGRDLKAWALDRPTAAPSGR